MLVVLLGCKDEEVLVVQISAEDFISSIEENPRNGLAIGVIKATTNQGSLTYSITEDVPNGAMAINSLTGELIVSDSTLFDFETNKTLTAKVKVENGDIWDNALVIITLTDVRTSVSILDFSAILQENPNNGQILGTVQGFAIEGSKEFSLSSTTNQGAMSINSSTGELSVVDSSFFDFEENPELLAEVTVKSDTVSAKAQVTLTLTDIVNTVATTDFSITIDENPSNGDVLGVITGQTNDGIVNFSIDSESNSGAFNIDGLTGELIVGNAAIYDFEINPVITGVINVSSGSTVESANVIINLNDVVEEKISFTQLSVSGSHFSPRVGQSAIEFNDKLWVISGWDENFTDNNEVWSTIDGTHWTNETNGASNVFPERQSTQSVVFDNKLWLVGGYSFSSFDDVWSTEDGIDWTQSNITGTQFSARSGHQVVTFKNKLWVIGGYASYYSNDIWSSSDGLNWELETSNAAFSERYLHQAVVFNDKLWVIGGETADGYTADIWSSNDGVNWTQVTSNAAFSTRAYHQLVVYNSKLWLIGGSSANVVDYQNDIWVSEDGIQWDQEEVSGSYFSKRQYHQVVVLNNELYIIGGRDADNAYLNDIWKMN